MITGENFIEIRTLVKHIYFIVFLFFFIIIIIMWLFFFCFVICLEIINIFLISL